MNVKNKLSQILLACICIFNISHTQENHNQKKIVNIVTRAIDIASNRGMVISKHKKQSIIKAVKKITHERFCPHEPSTVDQILECLETIKECNQIIKDLLGQPSTDFDCDGLTCEDLETVFEFLQCTCRDLEPYESKVCVLQSKVEFLAACECVTIRQKDFVDDTYVISESGCYCVGENLVGEISIVTSNVTIDLNNHTVSNPLGTIFHIGSNVAILKNITIKNGTIKVTGCDLATDLISVSDCQADASAVGILLTSFNSFICISEVKFQMRGNRSYGIRNEAQFADTTFSDKLHINRCQFYGTADPDIVDTDQISEGCPEQKGISFAQAPSASQITRLVITDSVFAQLQDGISIEIAPVPYKIEDIAIHNCIFEHLCSNGITITQKTALMKKTQNTKQKRSPDICTLHNLTITESTFAHINAINNDPLEVLNSGNGIAINFKTGVDISNLLIKRCSFTDINGTVTTTTKSTNLSNVGNGIAIWAKIQDDASITNISIQDTIFEKINGQQITNINTLGNTGNCCGLFLNVEEATRPIKNIAMTGCTASTISGSIENNQTDGIINNIGNALGIIFFNTAQTDPYELKNIYFTENYFSNITGSMQYSDETDAVVGIVNIGNGLGILSAIIEPMHISNTQISNCVFQNITGTYQETAAVGAQFINNGNGISILSTGNDESTLTDTMVSDCTLSNISGTTSTTTANQIIGTGNGVSLLTIPGSIENVTVKDNCFTNISATNNMNLLGIFIANGIGIFSPSSNGTIQNILSSNNYFNTITGIDTEVNALHGTGINIAGIPPSISPDPGNDFITSISINNCLFENIDFAGVSAQASKVQTLNIADSVFSGMLQRGASIEQNKVPDTMPSEGDSSPSCIQVINCHLQGQPPLPTELNNPSELIGIYLQNFAKAIVENCTASCFATLTPFTDGLDTDNNCPLVDAGYYFDNCANVLVRNSIAKDNGNGFIFCSINPTTDFSATTGIVQSCTAEGNSGFGFDIGGNATHEIEFYRNIACNNGTNFDEAITSAPIKNQVDAKEFHNVDCLLPTENIPNG